MTGKAYANRRNYSYRPKGDFYVTPRSLVWCVEDHIRREFGGHRVLDPCFGMGAISSELKRWGFDVAENDLYADGGHDYLTHEFTEDHVIGNPPFSLWDEFVLRAKGHCTKFMFIGRLNYFGTFGRFKNGLWDNLKSVYPFNRYADYQTPARDDGLFHVGAMATAWFVWDMDYIGKPTIEVVDVQEYATLGNFNKSQKD